MRLAATFAFLSFALVACAEFPALDGTIDPSLANAPYPDLVPLGPVLAQASASESGAANVEQALVPRLARLRARAVALRGPVIAPAVRARMLRGVR